MTSVEHARLMALFDRLAAAPPELHRRAFATLQAAAPELLEPLRRMLAADRSALEVDWAARQLAREVLTPVPRRVGDFDVQRELGRGGFSVVYVARQERPAREVALKVVHPGATPVERARLHFEADVLAQLQHPDVPRVFAVGEAGEWSWLALELIHGVPLERWPARRDAARMRALGARVARALEHAHRRGVVHGDLSARNVLVTPGDAPRVLDFGSARARSSFALPVTVTPGLREEPSALGPPTEADDLHALRRLLEPAGIGLPLDLGDARAAAGWLERPAWRRLLRRWRSP